MAKITSGDRFPTFTLPGNKTGNDESEVTIGANMARPVVLYCYPKDDTSGCTVEALDFSQQLQEFHKLGVDVWGLSPDPIKKHLKFRAKHGLEVALLSDENKLALEALGVWVEKSMYGRKYMGVERSTFFVGKDGIVLAAWHKVSVPGHVSEVLQTVKTCLG